MPSFGPLGEGWVTGQFILGSAVAIAGVIASDDWSGGSLVATQVVGGGLAILGVVIGIVGVRNLGNALTQLPSPKIDAHLVETGIYGHVRHPLYLGLMCGALGWALFAGSLLALAFTGAFAVFLDLKARREEAWLRERYPMYAHYARRVKRFVPGIY